MQCQPGTRFGTGSSSGSSSQTIGGISSSAGRLRLGTRSGLVGGCHYQLLLAGSGWVFTKRERCEKIGENGP
jgi:hypothetical protein